MMKNLLFTAIFLIVTINLYAQTDVLPPLLNMPADSSINQMPDVELDWYAVNGIGEVIYKVELDKDNLFQPPIATYTTATTSYSTENLEFGEKYFWRVRAINQSDTSDWSDIYNFSVFNRLVLADADPTPTNGEVLEDAFVELAWLPPVDQVTITGVTKFECQVDTSYNWEMEAMNLTNLALNATFFTDEDHGWAVGESGSIFTYENGDWTVETLYYLNNGGTLSDTSISESLKSINNGFIVGLEGIFIEYQDPNWILIPIETIDGNDTVLFEDDLYSIFALNSENMWVVGKGGKILHRDATSYWQEFSYGATKDLYSVVFTDESHGWAVGKGGTIASYTNGTWTSQTSNSTKDLFGVSFTDVDHGWAVGKSGTILFNNGTVWIEDQSNSTTELNSISMIDMNEGWAVGKNGILVYYDGNDWVENTSNNINKLNSVFSLNSETVWTVGDEGTIIKKSGDAFNSPMSQIFGTTPDKNSIDVENLLFDTKYFWRVRALNDADTSGWSSVKYFYSLSNVVLDKPIQNAIGLNPNVELKWDSIPGVTEYIYQVCTDPGFTFPCITNFTQSSSVVIPSLAFGTTYHWRVKAFHSSDTTDWSEERYFQIINIVELDSPEDGATGQNPDVVLSWEPITEEVKFIYQICADSNFTFPCITDFTEESSVTIYSLLFGATYHWRVKAVHLLDTTDWSDNRDFQIINTVLLTSPENNATGQLPLLTLTWNEIIGVEKYEVRWWRIENDTICDTVFTITPSFAMVNPLDMGEEYFWKVRAINNLDTTDWSATWAFNTEELGIDGHILAKDKIHMFPNPTNGDFYIELISEYPTSIQITILNIVGKTVFDNSFTFGQGTETKKIEINNLNSGLYFIRLKSGDAVYTEKLIIDK
jgi:photosystem II stability/assembly factor-like uncharacterized protein